MPLSMRADTTEYLTATFTADHDVTGSPVDVAVPPVDQLPTTWYPAEVLSVAQSGAVARWVLTYRILIGPAGGATQLEPGQYDWTVRLSDEPEVPIRKTSILTITAT